MDEVEELAQYNAECSRGIAHTPEQDVRMAEVQRRFDDGYVERQRALGWTVMDDGRLYRTGPDVAPDVKAWAWIVGGLVLLVFVVLIAAALAVD